MHSQFLFHLVLEKSGNKEEIDYVSMKSVFCWIVCVFIAVLEETAANHPQYISLEAQCFPDKIVATLETIEPFTGLVYSRNHPVECRVSGERSPNTRTVLLLTRDKCGFREGPAGHSREVDVYVQHDSFVQQVIDEQFLVRCQDGVQEGQVRYQNVRRRKKPNIIRDVTVTSSFSGRSNDAARPAFHWGESIPVSNLVKSTNLEVRARTPELIETINETKTVENDDKKMQFPGKISGWMEILMKDEDSSLTVSPGDVATLNIRVNNLEQRDAMISSCKAFRPGGEQGKVLTDIRGCSKNPKVFPPFMSAFNSRTKVKSFSAQFQLFKFPDSERVRFDCRIIICDVKCSLASCHGDDQSDENDISVLDELKLQTDLEFSEDKMKTSSETVENIANNPANLKGEEQERSSKVVTVELDEADMLCISPSKLVTAFSIILFVLMLALLFSCMLWLRARSSLVSSSPKNAPTMFHNSKSSGSPPLPLIGPRPPGMMSPRVPTQPLPLQRTRPPYLRVMQ